MKYYVCGHRLYRIPYGTSVQFWRMEDKTWMYPFMDIASRLDWEWQDSIEDLLDVWKDNPEITRFIVEALL